MQNKNQDETLILSFYTDEKIYQRIRNEMNSNECRIPWKLNNICRDSLFLNMVVVRPQNCPANYKVVWNGQVMESYPIQINILLYVIFDNCVPQNENKIDTLSFYLPSAFPDLEDSLITKLEINTLPHCTQ